MKDLTQREAQAVLAALHDAEALTDPLVLGAVEKIREAAQGRPDEVSYSDYVTACGQLHTCAAALAECTVDEAAEVWLPRVTQRIAIIFSFVGSNMTARHMKTYGETVARLNAAKDVSPG